MTTPGKASIRVDGERITVELGRASAPSLQAGEGFRAIAHGGDGLSIIPLSRQSFLAGTLSALSLGDIFGHLLAGIRSGKLVITRGALRKTVSMRDGQIVFATSSERHERLGNALIRLGLVAREQLDAALLETGPKARLGQVLTRSGLISAANLYSAMTFLVREIVVNLFEMADGEVLFLEGEAAADALKLPERTRSLVLEGMKRGEEVVRLRNRLPEATRVSLPPGQGPRSGDPFGGYLARGITLGELRPRYEGSEHAFLSWVDEQLRSGEWVSATVPPPAAPEPAPSTPRSVLERYSFFIAGVSAALRDAGQDLGELRAFAESPPPGLEEPFQGVTLSEDGWLDVNRIASNFGGEDDPWSRARTYEALDSFVAYALFLANNVLSPELSEALSQRFVQMQEGR